MPQSSHGFCILELCLAMSMGMFLIFMALFFYQNLKKETILSNQKINHCIASLEIQQFLSQDLRFSAYLAQATRREHLPLLIHFDRLHYPWFYRDRAVFGCEGRYQSCQRYLPKRSHQRFKADAALLVIYNVPVAQNSLAESMQKTIDPLKLRHQTHLQAGSMVLVSDGLHSDLFIASAVHTAQVFHEQTPLSNYRAYLSKTYSQGAEVTELQTIAYYLGLPQRANSKSRVFSLYRDHLEQTAEEIMTGICSLLFEYQVSPPVLNLGSALFKAAQFLTDSEWSLVCGVRARIQFEGGQVVMYEFPIPNRR